MTKATSKKKTDTADFIKLAKLFMHDATRLTPEAFKEYYLNNWRLISKDASFPMLDLTREFILETAWKDFIDMIMIISKVINDVAHPDKKYSHRVLLPVSETMEAAFDSNSLSFRPRINIRNNELAALNFVQLRFDLAKPKNHFIISNSRLLNAISLTETFDALELIKAGADVNKYSAYFGSNPILLAVAKGWNHISDEFSEEDLPGVENQKQIIEALLSRNDLDVNAVYATNGMTPLHIACLRGDEPTLIELLLQKGAKLDVKDCYDMTPADYLDFSYADVKKILPIMLDGFEFGTSDYAPNTSHMATIPTEDERARNVLLIKKIFQRMAHDGTVDEKPTKRPKF